MGQTSSYFTADEQKEILNKTRLTPRYLQEVEKRYSQLDTSKTKSEVAGVPMASVMLLPEVHGHKIAALLAEKFCSADGNFYPAEFADFFSALSSARSPSEKLDLLFEVLDVRKTGYLSGLELYRFYHVMLAPALSNKQIEAVVKQALAAVPNRKLPVATFREVVPEWQIVEKMTVHLQLTDD